MGEGACQLDISDRASWGRELTSENSHLNRWLVTLATLEGAEYIFYIWESIGEKTLSTFLHSSWGRGRVNFIFQTELVGGVN